MSTIGYKDWAVDLADVGAIYPMQGLEVPMVIAGVVFWLGWHFVQMRMEREEYEGSDESADSEQIKANLDRY